jgi:hypothetical protein
MGCLKTKENPIQRQLHGMMTASAGLTKLNETMLAQTNQDVKRGR